MEAIYELLASDPRLRVKGGARLIDRIRVGDKTVVHGPYLPLKKGNYEGQLNFAPDAVFTGNAMIDVCYNRAQKVITRRSVRAEDVTGSQVLITFCLVEDVRDVEIRLFAEIGTAAEFISLVVRGTPQHEANGELESIKERHNDFRFRAPVDLCRTPSRANRILVIGSC